MIAAVGSLDRRGSMPSTTRLIILPDTANSVISGVFGCGFLLLAIGLAIFQEVVAGLVVALLGVLGVVGVAYFLTSRRGLSSLPRVEIDDAGIRSLAVLDDTSINWSAVTAIEPSVRETTDGEDHYVRIWHSQRDDLTSANKGYYDLNLSCFLQRRSRSFGPTNEVAAWLKELRANAASGNSVVRETKAPRHIRCVVI